MLTAAAATGAQASGRRMIMGSRAARLAASWMPAVAGAVLSSVTGGTQPGQVSSR